MQYFLLIALLLALWAVAYKARQIALNTRNQNTELKAGVIACVFALYGTLIAAVVVLDIYFNVIGICRT